MCSIWYLWGRWNESLSSGWSLKVSLSKESSEWNDLARQSKLPSMGGWVTMGRLIITSGVIPEGIWDSVVGGWGFDGSTGSNILAFFLGGWLADFLGRDELAPGVVGGLLVSYHLRGGLRGAPSTEGGMASGYEGLVMDPCIGATLNGLGQLEEDEVLTPRAFSMANSKMFERRWLEVRERLGLRQRSSGNGALAWLLFRTKWRLLQGKWPF